MTRPIRLLLGATLCFAAGAAAQQPDSARLYVIRGRQVEAIQRSLTERVGRFHDSLAAELTRHAPDLLPRLEPPPPIATGYGLLPHIVTDADPGVPSTRLQIVSYGWKWSETLMRRELDVLSRLDSALARARERPMRPLLDSIVTGFRALIDRKKPADADVNYNWLWQAAVARSPAAFEGATRLSDALLARQSNRQSAADSGIERALALDIRRMTVPSFVRFMESGGRWAILVPVATDIQDTAFLNGFRGAVEENWRDSMHTVRLEFTVIVPESLYCRRVTQGSCRVPQRGDQIDLQSHIARFPPGTALLTTGGGSTHVTGGRAIVVSPHDAPRRMIAHEFGHLLGFRDGYLRGFRDAGADGYVITELVVDPADIMGSYKTGTVRASHFDRLMAAKDVPIVMQRGLDAFYARRDAAVAVQEFRRVLALDPAHYGANYQLAKALDLLGQPEAAREQWETVLKMALAIDDQQVATAARKRLSP